ncbi:Rne/Rng family ribonuclease [Gudongella sp. SC589]|jgi:ribonuclease G|uniref:Rne/Rng family ribonuclease n=1 Tax=Gudongella sp. SC589 TaxID=3385990 RepID=UPI003904DBCF
MNTIYIDSRDGINRICIVEDGRLVEYYKEDTGRHRLLGNVYRGRVVNILQGMEAAFVDIGEERNAYLNIKDALGREMMYSRDRLTIDQVLKHGEDIMVQVVKEPLGNKGPKVTTHISIPGRYMVLTPYSNRVNISKKIRDQEEIERLKHLGKDLERDNMGMIFRTVSQGVASELLQEEYKELVRIFEKIEGERNYLPTPKLIYSEPVLVLQILRDYYDESKTDVVTNSKEIYDYLKSTTKLSDYNLKDRLKFDQQYNMDYHMSIQMDMKEALSRKVQLKSGGYIVIDETEALTAIDVNTGKYVGSLTLSDTIVRTNIEAAVEIARQVRLRDIGGIIIVDFIDMKSQDNIDIVLGKLDKEFRKDKNKPYVVGMTKLNLVEVVRKRNRPTLDKETTIVCPTCNGRGRIRKNEA